MSAQAEKTEKQQQLQFKAGVQAQPGSMHARVTLCERAAAATSEVEAAEADILDERCVQLGVRSTAGLGVKVSLTVRPRYMQDQEVKWAAAIKLAALWQKACSNYGHIVDKGLTLEDLIDPGRTGELSLQDKLDSSEEALALCEELSRLGARALPGVTELDLYGCRLDDAGVIALSEAVRKGALAQCTKLWLGANQIGDAGVSALVAAIESGALPCLTVRLTHLPPPCLKPPSRHNSCIHLAGCWPPQQPSEQHRLGESGDGGAQTEQMKTHLSSRRLSFFFEHLCFLTWPVGRCTTVIYYTLWSTPLRTRKMLDIIFTIKGG